MIAILLAAGRGSRMRELTDFVPKPMLTLQGRPILEHVLLGLRDAGIEEVLVVVGYRGEQIETHFGSGERLGMGIHYARQEHPDGTARAVLLGRDLVGHEPFVLAWGDIVVEPGAYAALLASFQDTHPEALLSLNRTDDPWRGAAVYVDTDWRVTGLVEKPPRGTSTTPWNNAGIFVFQPLVFSYAERLQASVRGEYELPQAISAMIADGRDVRALPLTGFWSDLGTPEDLVEAEHTYPGRGPRP